jgi:hypothetical protein
MQICLGFRKAKHLNDLYLFSEENEIVFFEMFSNTPIKLLSIAFSTISIIVLTPLLYLVVLFEKV